MRNPSRIFGRRRAAALCLAAALGGFLGGCASSGTYFARMPRSQEGGTFPWDRVDIVSYEDDTRRTLLPGEYVAIENDELVLHSTTEQSREVLDLNAVEAVRLVPVDGVAEWLDVLTVDDLLTFDRVPPIARIELRDGTRVTPDPDAGETVNWTPERLGLVVGRGVESDGARTIFFDEIELVELREGASLTQTLRSPMFWVAGAVAAGAVILIGRQAGDPETTATR